jgi:N-methylhydantoinase A
MIGVDVGGTFTDVVSVADGGLKVVKVPSSRAQPVGPVLDGAKSIGLANVAAFNHASTVGLNSVITRRLPKVAFLATEGHRDILDFGRVWRPTSDVSNHHWRRSFGDSSRPLVPRYLRRGIRERMLASGDVFIPFNEDQARVELEVLARCNIEGVGICLLNSYASAEHEELLRALVRDVLGDIPCSISAEVSPLAKEYARASTTIIDVFMKLIYGDYTDDLVTGLRAAGFAGAINFADSAAMLMPTDYALEHPHRLVSAGPAAGAVSCAYFGGLVGETNLICCDIGGTSADVSVVSEGSPYVKTTFEIEHDLLINSLSTDVMSFGAGGGSIVRVNDAGELAVGPTSAGGDPGPACYGKGGTQPTVTDACVLIGILDPAAFLGGAMQLQPQLAERAFAGLDLPFTLGERIAYAYKMTLNNLAEGLFGITVRRGLDPRDYSLVAYGSAGPMLLPALLDLVKVRRVIVPPHPGLFSALGLLSSDLVFSDSRSAYTMLDRRAAESMNAMFESMERAILEKAGRYAGDVRVERTIDACYLGQSWDTPFVEVPSGTIDAAKIDVIAENFQMAYQRRYGNRFDGVPVQGVSYRVSVTVPTQKVTYPTLEPGDGVEPSPVGTVRLKYLYDDELQCPEYDRLSLKARQVIRGPAIIREPSATTYVLANQVVTVGSLGELIIERAFANGTNGRLA